jgi:ElaB/YqjD/DUF883 family membrane-anchored ribosome-binding protein
MTTDLEQVLSSISNLSTEIQDLKAEVKAESKELRKEIEDSNTRFDNYQKATQWVVNLAFSLIASATVITVVSSVFRR